MNAILTESAASAGGSWSDAPNKDSLIYYIGNVVLNSYPFLYRELNEDNSGYRQESRS